MDVQYETTSSHYETLKHEHIELTDYTRVFITLVNTRFCVVQEKYFKIVNAIINADISIITHYVYWLLLGV